MSNGDERRAIDANAARQWAEDQQHGYSGFFPMTTLMNAARWALARDAEATRLEQENARLRKALAAVPAETASAAWGHINAAGQLVVSEDYVRGHEATVAHVTAYVEHALRDALKETKNA